MSNLYYTFYQLSRRGLVIQTISETLFFMSFHIPSMGFKSGLFPGQSRTLIPWTTKYFFIDLAWWHDAPSCMNVQSHLGYQSLICGSRDFEGIVYIDAGSYSHQQRLVRQCLWRRWHSKSSLWWGTLLFSSGIQAGTFPLVFSLRRGTCRS